MRRFVLSAGIAIVWAASANGQETSSPSADVKLPQSEVPEAGAEASDAAGEHVPEPVALDAAGNSRAAGLSGDSADVDSRPGRGDATAARAAEADAAPADDASEEIICRRERVTGSHFRTRVCYKRSELERARKESQEFLRETPQDPITIPPAEG